ncbi:hypothetical protein HDV00_006255 [Rhizophlyctis rosea]|nr:hypothetical protein HDV00_006255 [Rhizophlyctis rosea]
MIPIPSNFQRLLLVLALVTVLGWVTTSTLWSRKEDETALSPIKQQPITTINSNLHHTVNYKSRVLYYSRHDGTISDFEYISKQIGIEVTVIKPGTNYGEWNDCLYKDDCAGRFLKALCSAYDYIVVGDIIPDGRPFLHDKCLQGTRVKIVLQATNRFDLAAPEAEEFKKLVRKRLTQNADRVYFVANNPFEAFYLCRAKINPPRYAILKPTGFSENYFETEHHPDSFKGDFDTVVFTVKANQHGAFLQDKLKELGIKFRAFEGSYGGPQILATYKAVIQLPYQVSVMSLPENLRHGAAYLLPTPEFFLTFCTKYPEYVMWHAYELCQEPRTLDKKVARLQKWTDWWQPEIREAVTYFGSWEELAEVLKSNDFAVKRRKAKEVMEGEERRIVEGWREVFGLRTVGVDAGESIWRTEEVKCDRDA